MKTPAAPKNLISSLEMIQKEKLGFEEVCSLLFNFSFEDFDALFDVAKKEISPECILRIPILTNECTAILMLWAPDSSTAIYDQMNAGAGMKILKGQLTKAFYRENSNFIEFAKAKTFRKNQIYYTESGGIQSWVNVSEGISASLHIYKELQINFEGVRIFDTIHRRLAYLSDKATSCSWNLPDAAFLEVVNI